MGSWVEIPFFFFFWPFTGKGKCGQVEPSPCYSKSELMYAYQVSDL